jgi:hypothetical protein
MSPGSLYAGAKASAGGFAPQSSALGRAADVGASAAGSVASGVVSVGSSLQRAMRAAKHRLASGSKVRAAVATTAPVVTSWSAVVADADESVATLLEFSWAPNGSLLNSFQHVVLVGSQQDGYTPHHSHRVEMCPAVIKVCVCVASAVRCRCL